MQPDVEIYLKDCPLDAIVAWLQQRFDNVETMVAGKKQHRYRVSHQGHRIPLLVIEAAAGKAFTCLWFQSDKTPWPDDISCAREVFDKLQCEVRCNAEGWNNDQEPDLWWRINAQGEGTFLWQQ